MRAGKPLLAAPLVLLAFAVGAPSAQATAECLGAKDCTTVKGPWISVPPPDFNNQYAGMWGMECSNDDIVGSDWVSQNPGDLVVALEQYNGASVYNEGPGVGFVYASNDVYGNATFQPLVGCGPQNASRSAPTHLKRSPFIRRIKTRRLAPNRTRTFNHRCRGDEKLMRSAHGVGFFQERPPAEDELDDVTVTRREEDGRIRVTVTTGSKAGDDEPVRLQIHAVCR